MKLSLVLASVAYQIIYSYCTICHVKYFLRRPGDNGHYVEGKSRYIWIPDDRGEPKLVDLKAPIDNAALAKAKNGANNQYWLYTRRNLKEAEVIDLNNVTSLRGSNYDGALSTKVIVHGWLNDGNSRMNPLITSAFLAVEDVNVIVVDWHGLAYSDYSTAVNGVPEVGIGLGNFLTWLFETAGGNWKALHLVGFSLGAHIVGNAGRTVRGRCDRITGLDPAGPLWINNSNALSSNSGIYVESIHTDSGLLGIKDPMSHADFYPNGGRNPQPGCSTSVCSHGRATELFASSIRTNHFLGRQCADVRHAELTLCNGRRMHMGNADVGKRGSGLYGLETRNEWPF